MTPTTTRPATARPAGRPDAALRDSVRYVRRAPGRMGICAVIGALPMLALSVAGSAPPAGFAGAAFALCAFLVRLTGGVMAMVLALGAADGVEWTVKEAFTTALQRIPRLLGAYLVFAAQVIPVLLAALAALVVAVGHAASSATSADHGASGHWQLVLPWQAAVPIALVAGAVLALLALRLSLLTVVVVAERQTWLDATARAAALSSGVRVRLAVTTAYVVAPLAVVWAIAGALHASTAMARWLSLGIALWLPVALALIHVWWYLSQVQREARRL